MRLITAIEKSLTTRIAPMVYVMMFVSVIIGFCFFTGLLVAGSESVLYSSGVLIDSKTWGLMLFTTASIAEIGFLKKNLLLVRVGGLSGFSLWLLASIDLALESHWYVLATVGLFHLVFHGYVYLASSMGVLERTMA